MSRFFRVALLLILTLNLRAQVEEEVVLKTATGNIAGSLLLPDLEKISPLVLIIAGSGPTDRNGNNPMMTNNSLKMLAKGLQSKGIASIRYDKRGIGESQSAGPIESDLRFEHYIKDAEDWITLLRKDERFSEVIVLGHSEGSLIGMIASQTSEVDKFISVAGTGFPAGEIIRNQLKEQPEFILNQSLPIIEKLEKGELEENVPPMLASLFRKSVQPYLISWFKYAPQKEIAKLDIPVLIVQGTTDIQVGVDNAEKLASANEGSELHIIEGMNHILKESAMEMDENLKTYYLPELDLINGLLDHLVKFVER